MSNTENTPIKIINNPIKHNKYSLLNILIVSQLANRQIGINKHVKTINNKLIPSTPNKKYDSEQDRLSLLLSVGKALPPSQFNDIKY